MRSNYSTYDQELLAGMVVLKRYPEPMARLRHTTGLRSTNPMYGREDAR